MKTKQKVLIVIAVLVILVIARISWVRHTPLDLSNDTPPDLKQAQTFTADVETFLTKQMGMLDPMWDKSEASTCSFDLFGQDDKYIYGFGMCQEILSGDNGELSITNVLGDPLRISHSIPNGIISYERPTSECPKCGGTKPEDILPAKYLETYNSGSYYQALLKENLDKMLSGQLFTKETALLVIKENMNNNPEDPSRSIGFYSGKYDAVGDGEGGWNFALYLNYSGPDGNRSDIAAVCRGVGSDLDVKQKGIYNPKNGTVVKNINPETCLPF